MGLKEESPNTRMFYGVVTISGVIGFYQGKTLGIKAGDTILIGRDRNLCALLYPPESTGISKVHCKLWFDAARGRVGVRDCSKNGTFLGNGERMCPEQEYFLSDGEQFYLTSPENTFVVHTL
ncbi:MAG: FHA domain-containing protein [Clostridiales bacterium]|jgi:hypothetical protein|nr:FHA domain-containing protein [Clostridiales bacterium]